MFVQQSSYIVALAGILAQLDVIHSFPTKIAENVEIIAPALLDLELIEPAVDFLTTLEKGNEKTHRIAESYRAKEPDITSKSSVSCDQSRQTVITTDHVSPSQQPPYSQPPMQQASYSDKPSWDVTKIYDDFKQLVKFLGSEKSPADAVPSSSSWTSLPESKNASGVATAEPSTKSYTAPTESHNFEVKMYNNPQKMCYHIIKEDDYEETEKCITFSMNLTSKANLIEGKSSDNVENVNLSLEITYQLANPASMKQKDESEIRKSVAVERETSSEVNPSDEDASQSTTQTLKHIKFDKVTENSLEDDNFEVKRLVDYFLGRNLPCKEAAADKIDKPDSTEFTVAQETTTERILLLEESTEVNNVFTKHPTAKSKNGTESNEMQQNSTSGQILALNAKISEDPIATSTDEQLISSEKVQALSRLFAEYFANRIQISSASSKSVSGDEDFNDYVISPVLPFSFDEPMITGRNADDSAELVTHLDFDDLVLPEDKINSFDRSFLPSGAVKEAHSEMYLVSQQPENMRCAESYLSPPEEEIVTYEF